MSENCWQLDGFAFTLAVSAMGRDRLPYPLSYRPEFMEHRDDYERLRARMAQRLQQVFDERLHRALTTLLEPRVRIEIHGFHGPKHAQVVRIHAGLAGQVATIAQQLPGPDREHGRDVVITQCGVHMLVAQIAAKLPRCQGGSHYPFTARRSDLDQPVYSRHPTRLSPVEELNRFLRRPRASTGEITVYPGAAYDARPTTDGHAFIWLDYPTDGRYLLFNHDDNDFSIAPGPTDELMRQLQSRIDTVNRARTGAW
ncbi:ESX secretion-associated protein EspG [Nocardia sp. NBC_00508]|uniref:ESX secretion-associated protein EspG n=1 Tax=Nocardia sp. NBC_00508 TaxID=2975992 RepID=UPI002E812140|nr:ESX secretion-associated protein EspG [Nocardia sp. NBC_00508]WUD63576.1 ESX secretion-associated protein EspG [Nocardia sp. NBC_00508]